MKMILSLALALIASSSFAEVIYSNSAEFSASSSQIKLANASYALIPTVTEVRKVPGCMVGGDTAATCTEVVVLKSEAVVQVTISYEDSKNSNGEGYPTFATLNFKLSDFDASDVESLKAAYPSWKHPMSKAGKEFANKNLSLSVVKTEKTIKVMDMKKSKLCATDDYGSVIVPGCKDVVVYKDALTTVKLLTVNVK